MNKSDLFSYLSAFATIVLAVALTDLVQSTHRLIRARSRVKWDVLPLLAAAFVYLAVLSEFFSLWGEVRVERFTFYGLVWLMTVPTLVTFAAFAVLPDEVPESGLDLTDFYFANRRYLVALIVLMTIGDLTRNLIWLGRHDYLDDPRVWQWFVPLTSAIFGSLALIWYATTRRLQLIGMVLLLIIGNIGSYQWTIDVTAKQ